MAKQAELSKLVTELQRGRMDSLVAWMGKAEAILASLAEPPGSREELAEQCGRKESLLEQLEEQQATVSSISHFILVESEETRGLEEELALLGERWHGLCRGCEERHAHMEMLASLWAEVNSQGEEVARWMADVEMKLRKMELEEVEGERLQEQERQVRVSTPDKHNTWWSYITMWKRLEKTVVLWYGVTAQCAANYQQHQRGLSGYLQPSCGPYSPTHLHHLHRRLPRHVDHPPHGGLLSQKISWAELILMMCHK